jgi:allophanate hydrolase subunit 2
MPYIVAADHGTTRGFAKLGYVIQVDLAKLAQAKPGDKVRFTSVTEPEAVEALTNEQQYYSEIITQVR